MILKNIIKISLIILLIIFSKISNAQVTTYTFIDPCTKEVNIFSVPLQGGKTTIIFLNRIGYFDSNDLLNGTFSNWINQVYGEYRKISPCSQQQSQVTQNQITSQIIGGVVQSVVGSIMSSNQSSNGSTENNNEDSEENNNTQRNGNNNTTGNNENNSSNQGGGQSQPNQTNGGSSGGTNNGQGNGTTGNGGANGGTTGSTQGRNPSTKPTVNNSNNSESNSEEVAATTTINLDSRTEKGDNSSNDGGGSGRRGGSRSGGSNSNPIIVSSDLTSAQNLDGRFTGIINISTSRSSMTGLSNYGVTSMIWLNLNQFAISAKYSKIHFDKSQKLKFVHNLNLTGVYTYGNYLVFLGYSGILNAGKFGVTGLNLSAAASMITKEKTGYYSPSATFFYTKPFQVNKRFMMSPEIYVMSTPLVYSTKDRITITDRYVSGFIGTGMDYQISKRFKINLNYKANMSTKPNFPILSFFLIGSKVNL